MTISDQELTALRNLMDKHAGKDVDWINITDARALTDLGLARRNGGGWVITPAGMALVGGGPPAAASATSRPANVQPLRLAPDPDGDDD